jgi:hypothetical protein
MPEQFYDRDFPNLRTHGWRRTSEPANYNCIAYAAADTSRYWWPNLFFPEPTDDYWPGNVPHEETVAAFVQAFATCGYAICDGGELEPGFEKVALYALHGVPRHAALQQEDGSWRSKLGPHEDIETTLEGLRKAKTITSRFQVEAGVAL